MRNRSFPHFLLILAFVVGQWFAVVHATKHELTSEKESATCEVCAVAHGGGGLTTVAALLLESTFDNAALPVRRVDVVAEPAFLLPQGRAPPDFLANRT